MSEFETFEDNVRELAGWGNTPMQIAAILEAPYAKVYKLMVAMKLVIKKDRPRAAPPPAPPRIRANAIKRLDAQISFYQGRARDLARYRDQLVELQQSGQHLQQKIEEARR
jgi:hypothetical protein